MMQPFSTGNRVIHTLLTPFVILIFCGSFTSSVEHTDQYKPDENLFAQFYVVGIESGQEAQKIDEFIRSQEGILMSRTDATSRIYFGIFSKDSGIDQATFETWLSELGFEISCYRQGMHGTDVVYSKETFICE